jgi:hypothetical protein
MRSRGTCCLPALAAARKGALGEQLAADFVLARRRRHRIRLGVAPFEAGARRTNASKIVGPAQDQRWSRDHRS